IFKGVRRGAPPFLHFVHLALALCLKLVPPAHMLVEESALYCRENDEYSFTLFYTFTSDREWTSAADVHFQSCASAIAFMQPLTGISPPHFHIYTDAILTSDDNRDCTIHLPVYFFYCSAVIF
ncbi:hypothetical protein, partial [Leyella stercorea]|uniref:hypothetical protein n=1 Tax=Leyella stercorea TaxID=363265 RepID=UPI002FDB1FBD